MTNEIVFARRQDRNSSCILRYLGQETVEEPLCLMMGYVVGMSTNLTEGQYEDEKTFLPHFAGIPSHVIANAVDDMDLGIRIPL